MNCLIYFIVFHIMIPFSMHFYGAYKGINQNEDGRQTPFAIDTQIMFFLGILTPLIVVMEKIFTNVNNVVESKGAEKRSKEKRKKVLELRINKLQQIIAETHLEDKRMMSWVSTLDELEEELSKY